MSPVRSPSTVRYTYADHQSIPEDHKRHEIVDGELVVTPTPRFNHQRVALDLAIALDARASTPWERSSGPSPCTFTTSWSWSRT
ncbi:MAG: hypothetical protein ACOC8K_03555 [Gemmatimonadota bacterium]